MNFKTNIFVNDYYSKSFRNYCNCINKIIQQCVTVSEKEYSSSPHLPSRSLSFRKCKVFIIQFIS